MKYLFLFLLVFTSGAAVATEPGSQYQQQAEAGDRRAQYYLADTWVSSGDYEKAEYWAQKAAAQGDGDALALLAQLKIRNPQQADYPQARQLAEKAVKVGHPVQHADRDQYQIERANVVRQIIDVSLDQPRFEACRLGQDPPLLKKSA